MVHSYSSKRRCCSLLKVSNENTFNMYANQFSSIIFQKTNCKTVFFVHDSKTDFQMTIKRIDKLIKMASLKMTTIHLFAV